MFEAGLGNEFADVGAKAFEADLFVGQRPH